MAVAATSGCLWYWDGDMWNGPTECGTCDCTGCPEPTVAVDAGTYVMVDCPNPVRKGKPKKADKHFAIWVPFDWKPKLVTY